MIIFSGEQFPHHSFVVDYCQAVLQQEENLDESFSSENSDPPLGPDHARSEGLLLLTPLLGYRQIPVRGGGWWYNRLIVYPREE